MTENRLTITEAATHFDVTERTIRRWIESGKLTVERTDGQRYVLLDIRTAARPNDQNSDNGVESPLESENRNLRAQLLRADSEITHLREQLARHDDQLTALTQSLDQAQQLQAIQAKTNAQLTDQLDSSRQLIEEKLSRSLWQRLKATFVAAPG
jgi:excisionase family DNA binding protein